MRDANHDQHDFLPELQVHISNQSAGHVCKEVWRPESLVGDDYYSSNYDTQMSCITMLSQSALCSG